jgi:predicted lipoprotein
MSLNFERIKKRLRVIVPGILMLSIALLLLPLSGCKQGDYFFFYVVEEEEKEEEGEKRLEYFKDEKFDADKIVEDIWENNVVPAILEQAVELRVVIDELAKDPETAGEQYGHREQGGDYPWNFIVKSEARIVAANTRSRKGTLSIDVPPYDGEADATIWIGPIITSYSIRDSLDFISFTTGVTGASGVQYEFDTQVQFAEVSNSLNRRGNQNILPALEPELCFTLTDDSLQRLGKKDIPDNVLSQLKNLKDNPCTSRESFWDVVKNKGGEDAEQYKELVFKYADTNGTGRGKPLYVYGAITHERSGKIIITPVQMEFVEEGQS